jgi:hypothetical protein
MLPRREEVDNDNVKTKTKKFLKRLPTRMMSWILN